jgi:nucleotide-binding universal stress UspA family protein
MLPIKTILHPTDFSEPSGHAFRLACSLARDYGARLVVTHIVPIPVYGTPEMGPMVPAPGIVEEEMRQALEAVQPSDPAIAVEHRLALGDAAGEIVSLAREVKADLIVMGTHGRSGVGRLLLGSVAEAVLRRAPCPVLTLKMPVPPVASAPGDVECVPAGLAPAGPSGG